MKKYVCALCIIFIIIIIILIKLINRHQYLTNRYLNVPKHNIQDRKFKTGDIVLFKYKPTDIRWKFRYLLCAAIFGTHITHMGIVVVLNNEPFLYECGMDRGNNSMYDLLSNTYISHNTTLCTLTPLYDNIKHYNGYVFHHSYSGNVENDDYSIFNFLKERTRKTCKLTAKRLLSILSNNNACDEDDSYTTCIEIAMNLLKYLNILKPDECVYNYNFCDILKLIYKKYDNHVLLNNYLLENYINSQTCLKTEKVNQK